MCEPTDEVLSTLVKDEGVPEAPDQYPVVVGEEGGDWLGRSGSIVSAPGVVERRLMSRRASTSR